MLRVTWPQTGDAACGIATAASVERTSFSHLHRPFPGRMRQHHGEFFASVAGDKIIGAKALLDRVGHDFQAFVAGLMTVTVVVEFEMIHIAEQKRQRLLQPDVTAPFLQQALIKPAPVGDLRKAVDAGLFAFLRKAVALIDKYLDQDFEVPFLPGNRLKQFLQFLLRRLALSNLSRQAGAEPVEMLLQ